MPAAENESVRELAPVAPGAARAPLRLQVDDFQRRLIRECVARHSGSWAAAARELGLHRSNLHHLAARLGLRD
jgi:anaerobic nitric oxide reductase transcription regulator